MKHIKTLTITLCLLGTNTAFGADWTPHLKMMQNDCANFGGYGDIMKLIGEGKKTNMSKKLQADIVKYTYKDDEVDIRLKNATAFGQPITRIVAEYPPTSYVALHIYFANGNFNKIKPKLKPNKGNFRTLSFDSKNKKITCTLSD